MRKNFTQVVGISIGMVLALISSCNKEAMNNSINEKTADVDLQKVLELIEPARYYWSGGTKVPLTIDSTSIIIHSTADSSSLKARLTDRSQHNVEISRLRTPYFVLKSKEKIINIDLHEINDIDEIFPSLAIGRLPAIPTGEILLKPKSGTSIESILDTYKGIVSLVGKTKYNTFTIKVEKLSDLLQTANAIYESGTVEWCHPDFVVEKELSSNDEFYSLQYYLHQANNYDINAPQAWDLFTSNNCTVRVAVIDDGVENHVELTGRILPGFTPLNANGQGAPQVGAAHGQAVAGIIGATRDNTIGIAGIASNALIIPVNIFVGGETPQDIASAINWSWDDGEADVLSNSWNYTNISIPNPGFDAITDAITNARTQGRNGKGAIVVFSSGNHNPGGGHLYQFNGVAFPANVSGVIAVGAIDRNGNIWNYSSRGAEMDLVAPSGLTNTGPGDVATIDRPGSNGYDPGDYTTTFGGTSAACPQVAGVAALLLSVNPNLTEAQVRTTLQSTATDMGSTGFDNTYGYGRVNAYSAVRSLFPTEISGPTSSVCTGSTNTYSVGDLPAGASVTWSSSPTGMVSLTTAGNSVNVSKTGSSSGSVILSATITMSCGSFTLTKAIHAGPPIANSLQVLGSLTIPNSMTPGIFGVSYMGCQVCGSESNCGPDIPVAGILEIQWSVPNATVDLEPNMACMFGPPGASAMVFFPSSGQYHISVRARNACGWSDWSNPKIVNVY